MGGEGRFIGSIVSQHGEKVHEIPMDKQAAPRSVISLPEVMYGGRKGGAAGPGVPDVRPADALAGAPRVEVIGDGELRMGPHRGILAYGTQEIHISGGNMVVLVRGSGLELRAMTPEELLITGTITAVEFVR